MKQKDLYAKLVDLYAGHELPEELTEELETASFTDPELAHDMRTLRQTVQALRDLPAPRFGEESFHRILFRMYALGAEPRLDSPTPLCFQYQLPMSG